MNKLNKNDKGTVKQGLGVRQPQPANVSYQEVIRYWMIELTSTDGAVQNFYVKAKNHQDALKIAEGYLYLGNTSRLRKRNLVLRPSTEEIYP